MEEIKDKTLETVEYNDDNIRHLSDMDHVRTRPGMYIGRLGDGSHAEDGIYVLLKEIIDNSIDEFKMNAGKRIEIEIIDGLAVSVRDFGRGIPQGKMIEAVSMLNTGGKYDSKAFKKSVGLNGVGTKAVNALSANFEVRSYREGKVRIAKFQRGILQTDVTEDTNEETGTYIYFEPDATLFLNYKFQTEFVETMLRNYTYLNTGLEIYYNNRRIVSRNGLKDLLEDTMDTKPLYDIVHLKGEDIEIAFTHTNQQYGEEYTKKYVAVPGTSEHHTGLALDLYFTIDGKDVYENEDLVQYPDIWDAVHARLPEFGFILRFPEDGEAITGYAYEPWHIRYLDSPEIAKEITDSGITLEEYLKNAE